MSAILDVYLHGSAHLTNAVSDELFMVVPCGGYPNNCGTFEFMTLPLLWLGEQLIKRTS